VGIVDGAARVIGLRSASCLLLGLVKPIARRLDLVVG